MLVQTCKGLVELPTLKLFAALGSATLSFFFGDMEVAFLVGLGVLVTFDLITGILAARKSNDDFILSRMIASTGIKAGVYLMCISAGSITENSIKHLPDGLKLINDGILGVFILSELTSILENAGLMGYNTPKRLLKKIKNVQNKF